MKVLKFSSDYKKLPLVWRGTQAELLSVVLCDVEDANKYCPAFVRFDTAYRGKKGNYKLDFKEAILLVFIHRNTGRVFTTVRKYSDKKFSYYRNAIGESFLLKRVEKKVIE